MTIRRNFWRRFRAGMTGGTLALLLAAPAWSQVVPELPPALPEPAKVEVPKEVVKEPKEAVKDARDEAKDALKQPREDLRDATKDARDAARDTTRDTVPGTVRDARDATRETLPAVPGTVRDTRDAVRDTTRDAVRDTVRDTTRDAARINNLRAADLGLTFGEARNGWLSISAVAPSASIGRVGLRTGDYILSVNGQRITREADFVRFLVADGSRAARLPIVVWRDGRQMTLEVEPALLLEGLPSSHGQAGSVVQFGVVVDSRYTDQVVVQQVIPRSPAHSADIRAGDVLTAIDGQRLASPSDLESLLGAEMRSSVRVELLRQTQVSMARNSTPMPHTTHRPIDAAGTRVVTPAHPAYSPAPLYGPEPIYQESPRGGRRGVFGGRR